MKNFLATEHAIVFGWVVLMATQAGAVTIYDSGGFEDGGAFFKDNASLAGQDGWLETAGPSMATVVNSFAKDGVQSVLVERKAGDPGHAHRFGVPLVGINEPFVSITWDMFVNTTAGLDSGGFGIEVEMADSVSTINRVGGMWLDGSSGKMFMLDSETSVALGRTVSLDAWHSYELLLDLDNETISGYIDGSPEFVDQLFINSISASDIVTVGSIIATATDSDFLDVEGSAFFDNYKVETFPEPKSAAIVLGVGAAMLGTRWNRRNV